MKRTNTLLLVQLAIFTAIELIFCFTPLGSLPLGPGIVATLSHIPVIIVAIVLGKKAGTYMGCVFGISSLIIWTAMPPNPLVAFAFSPFAPNGNLWSLIICVVPRVLFPFITAIVYEKLKTRVKDVFAAAFGAIIGTAFHSVLVLSLIYLAFNSSPVVGGNYTTFIVAWGGINAIMEIIVAAVVAAGLIVPLSRMNKKA